MAYVVVRDRNGKTLQKLTLESPLVIGRSGDCGLRLDDTQVSRHHCLITPTPKGWLLRDQSSRNGIQVNGAPVQEVLLHNKDTIQIGSARLTFHSTSRASNPLQAGLPDAESSPPPHTPSAISHLEPSESSLYATRVMIAPNDESTVAGAQAAFRDSADSPSPSPHLVEASPPQSPRRKWAPLVGALGLIAASVAIWLYSG